ncbi:hypothetical protein ES705_33040 [subsurface metagenome]
MSADTKYKGCTHVYLRRLEISRQDVHRHQDLFNYLRLMYLDGCLSAQISPISDALLNCLPTLSFVPALLQVWTLCRYNELKQISFQTIKRNEPFVINSSKSKHTRTIKPFPWYAPGKLRKLSNLTMINVVSYDSYKISINRAKKAIALNADSGILDVSHIWRHIEASWMYELGIPLEDISYKMGHLNSKTTRGYFRPNLSPNAFINR